MLVVLGIDVDLDQAKNFALIAAAVCLVGALVAIWVLQSVLQKVVVALLLLLLGFAVWSQREALQDCAAKVQTTVEILTDAGTTALSPSTTLGPDGTAPADAVPTTPADVDTSCTFFGIDVSIP